ncbi:MAG: metallophosphoesterase [Vicinamibacteria bacterium]
MRISRGALETEAWFAFPKVGRPVVSSGDTPPSLLFEAAHLHFHEGGFELSLLGDAIRGALADRLCLVPTGRPPVTVPLALGGTALLREAVPGPGPVVVPALYGLPVLFPPGLAHRQLYDVAVRGDEGPRVLAPHAAYHRRDWTDFGLVHVTDLHVARRIDRFRGLLAQAGRHDASRNVLNWNDRFRGFVKYANGLYRRELLDVVVATGDLYDYMFEDGDDHAEGGNAAFLRQLVLGQAPGPDFPEVEELLVPILMTPGNHDYRKHPYDLVFDLTAANLPRKRIRNYEAYRIGEGDAAVLTNRLHGGGGSGVPQPGAEAIRMLHVDEGIRPYKDHLGNTGSYVTRLGPHRIAMLDSGHDAGLPADVPDLIDAIRDEDFWTLIGGSPNCTGVDLPELHLVQSALATTPPEGLFLVGLHAPLFNVSGDEYPWYLRQTQREASHGQATGFLARHDGEQIFVGADIDAKVRERHRLWFGADGPDRHVVPFVKRLGAADANDDLLDHGVSRGFADQLMRVLAGATDLRAADVVLAGHTHCYNEFTVRPTPAGELAYFMDFYTRNPARYYATRFTRSWQKDPTDARGQRLVPVTGLASVEIAEGSAPHGHPWPLPHEAVQVTHHVHVPPYADPLSHAADPRAWWEAHRPLVLQTGALGPLKRLDEYSGFRLLSVRRNVVERIHFVPIVRLEESGYRASWEEVIRPDPERRHRYHQRSLRHHAPLAAGAPAGASFAALRVDNVVYRDGDGRLHELWQKGAESGTSDLTALAGAARATGDPALYFDPVGGVQVALYRGSDGHVQSLYWAEGAVGRDSLGATASAAKVAASGRPAGFAQQDGTNVVVYRTEGDRIHSLYWRGQEAPRTEDLSGSFPPAAGDPAPFVNTSTGTNVVVYRADDRQIHALYWTGQGAVGHDGLSFAAGGPRAAGDPVAYYIAAEDSNHVVYRGVDQHLHELWWRGGENARHVDLTAAAGAPAAADEPSAYYSPGTRTKHVVFRSGDGHLHEIASAPDGPLETKDLTLEALAPPAASRPVAYAVEGANTQHVVYRGPDGQVHEIRWALHQVLEVMGVADEGRLWRTTRRANGTWDAFTDLEAYAGERGRFKSLACAEGREGLQVCGVTEAGDIWHTLRMRSGSWHGFGDVKTVAGAHPGPFDAVSCAEDDGALHVCGLSRDGGIWHATRRAAGWQGFGDVRTVAGAHPGPFASVSCAVVDRALHLCGVTRAGLLWHCVRLADGSWIGFGDVTSQAGRHPGRFTTVGCAAGSGGELHVCGTTEDGGLWHTIRRSDRWEGFGDVKGQAGDRGRLTSVACMGAGTELHVCATTADGGLWHTIRRERSWEGFGDVKGEAGQVGPVRAVAGAS